MSEFMLHLYRDDHHLKRIGACKDGSLFWIDSQFVTEDGAPVDYLCTYRFAADGQFTFCKIERLGPRDEIDAAEWEARLAAHIRWLGPHSFGDIRVQPFSIRHDGHIFGAAIRTEEVAPDDPPLVDLLPGHTLMFFPPWEEGGYDT
ncbi:hypothetical protein [Roseovarius sp.]|uniref:hypothetical protein n=1 Tax=Roseovarius sp. TaxID=1486281 RepID=UPI0026332FD6|nr:hypothetical protein [Roseovarius sp.]MDM8168642.1 hypothetical protein [Roseovarius sp.]